MTETTSGWCIRCKSGDHSHHVPALAGICIGCACPQAVTSDE